jgi:tyrosine-protein phosphatase YwqE
VIDLHSHMLPGIDDGARDLDEALAMARAYVADGVRSVVATPHIYPGVFDNQPAQIEQACQRLQLALADHGIPLELQWAAEVRASGELLDMLAQGQLCFLGHDGPWRHLLLELPDGQIPLGTDRLIDLLAAHHVRPVIAHPERNKAVMADPRKLAPLVARGCLLQVTAGSLLGEFGSKAEATSVDLLDLGWVSAVASDAHRVSNRAPRMLAARNWLVANRGAAVAHRLTQEGPAHITARAKLQGGASPSAEVLQQG